MSTSEEQPIHAGAQEEDEFAGAVPVRRAKRRNCMVVPGSSNPKVAQMFYQAMMKEIGEEEQEGKEVDPNPENE